MNPRVKSVETTQDYQLILTFTNDEKRIFNCNPILDFGVFKELKDVRYFMKAKVDTGTVVWPNEQDLCPDTLYEGSQKI